MAQIKITLTKSPISRIPAQRKTVVALGLGKMGSSTIKEDTAAVRAMAASISHLVTVTEVATSETAQAEVSGKPSSANKVAEIKAYLDAEGIGYDSSSKKADLLELIK